MGAAAAQVELELVADLLLGGMRIAIEQGLERHDHAVQTIAALRALLVDEGLLDGSEPLEGAQAFERGDFVPRHALDGYDTGPGRHAVDQHRTGAAFAQAAAE